MFFSAFWSGADQDQLADQPTVLGSDLLGDAAAEGKAQQVDFGEAEQLDKGDRVSGHRCDIVGRLAARTADASGHSGEQCEKGAATVFVHDSSPQ
jgi:hypothetical protein